MENGQARADSYARGTNTASASSYAAVVNGREYASTDSYADGAGAVVAGRSEAGGEVDMCVEGAMYDAARCRTFAPSVRSSGCTNAPPDDRYTCEQQASWGKCDYEFIFKDSWCLQSCGRCGGKFFSLFVHSNHFNLLFC